MSEWRVPPAVGDIQVNCCRNPNCVNFGIPAETVPLKRGAPKGARRPRALPDHSEASCPNRQCQNHGRTLVSSPDVYWKHGGSGRRYRCRSCGTTFSIKDTRPPLPGNPGPRDRYSITNLDLRCNNCGEYFALKSNLAISQEIARVAGYLMPRSRPSCRNEHCANYGKPIEDYPELYYRHGKTAQGSQRYSCRACGKTFAVQSSTSAQRKPEKNILFFKLLHSRISLSKIASVLEIAPTTVYAKIDFLHDQCLRFMGDRERDLPSRPFGELFLATDRQSYLTNWQQNEDARNVQITGIGTADLRSGYVFAMNVAYDPTLDPLEVEADAIARGDYNVNPAYRHHARVWLEGDYGPKDPRDVTRAGRKRRGAGRETTANPDGLEHWNEGAIPGWEVQRGGQAEDLEDPDELTWDRRLPDRGMLVHQDYTMHAHFRLMRHLTRSADQVNFYVEPETGMRAALLAAFQDDIDRRFEAFQVDVTKELTVNQRRSLVGRAKAEYRAWLEAGRASGKITWEDPALCRLLRIEEAIDAADVVFNRNSRRHEVWIRHPFPSLAEPRKRVLHLTGPDPNVMPAEDLVVLDDGEVVQHASSFGYRLRERRQLNKLELARLIDEASLHAIDRYFMQIRREIGELERGIPVASNRGRIWYGYSPYDLTMIQKLIDIHRVYYNFIQVGADGKTRAERLGIARGKIRHQDVIYHR